MRQGSAEASRSSWKWVLACVVGLSVGLELGTILRWAIGFATGTSPMWLLGSLLGGLGVGLAWGGLQGLVLYGRRGRSVAGWMGLTGLGCLLGIGAIEATDRLVFGAIDRVLFGQMPLGMVWLMSGALAGAIGGLLGGGLLGVAQGVMVNLRKPQAWIWMRNSALAGACGQLGVKILASIIAPLPLEPWMIGLSGGLIYGLMMTSTIGTHTPTVKPIAPPISLKSPP